MDQQKRIKQAVERVRASLDSSERKQALGQAVERARQTVVQLRDARRVDPKTLNRPVAL